MEETASQRHAKQWREHLMNQEWMVFTGTLSSMTREQAQALVFALGGHTQTIVTSQTTQLVIGTSCPTLFNDRRSTKWETAERRRNAGQLIGFMDERTFLEAAIDVLQRRIRNLQTNDR